MAWTDLGAWTSRAVVTKTRLDQISDNFDVLKAHAHDGTTGAGQKFPWTSFTSTWTATTTNPTNFTLTCAYARLGNLVAVRYLITCDASFTAGTGTYDLTIPLTAIANYEQAGAGSCFFFDSSTGNRYVGAAILNTTGLLRVSFDGTAASWSATVPVAPATSDRFRISLVYEPA